MIGYFDIKGEINNPGVYKLEKNITINDAINIAGGLTKKSDTSKINLSKQVKDEMVIYIFKKSDYIIKTCECEKTYKNICTNQDNIITEPITPTSQLITTTIPTTTKLIESTLININDASKDILKTLEGIGESKAENIIKYRLEFGLFNNIEEIKNVSGIGNAIFEKIKNFITI